MKIRLLICFFLPFILFSLRGYSQTCNLSVSIGQSEPTICSGNSITLKASVTSGTGPFTYSWSTGETSQSISVNKAGTYTVKVTSGTPGCSATQSVTITSSVTPDPPTAQSQVVCPNSRATLMATAPGGNYQWYDASGNFLMNGASYTTPPITTYTIFYVQTTVGGCTSNRTPVGVSLTTKPVVTGATICAGSMATLMASGGDTYAWYPTIAATGTPLSTSSNYTTPILNNTTTYYVVVTSSGCASNATPVTATVNPAPQQPTAGNQTICAGNSVNLHADAPSGIFNWYSVPTGGTPLISSPDYTTPVLNATTTYYVENVVNECVSSRKAVTVTITQNPTAPNAQTQTICYQTSIALTAGNNNALTYKWYSTATGNNVLFTGKTYTTPVLTTSTTYYVTLVNGSCESDRAAITVTVNPQLPAPTSPDVMICPNTRATLTASAQGGTFQWYDAPTGGNLLSSANMWTTPVLMVNTTYYVQNTVNTCISPRTAVTVNVLASPGAPLVSNTSACYNSPGVLSASSPTNNYAWYAAATGGTPLSTAQVYVTPNLTATTTYYVETTNANGCESARVPETVTVIPTPPAPTVSGTTTICTGTSASLTANAPSGGFQWYAAATGGTMLFTGSTYNTPNLMANIIYYVENVIGGCEGPRTAVKVTVTQPIDPQFEYPKGSICSADPNPVPVIYNPAGGTFSATPAGLVFVSTTTGVINTAASAPGVYEISFAGNGTCPHTSTSRFGISITDASFSYNGPFCQDGADPLPVFGPNGSAGTFTATPAGLTFKNVTTGQIDVSNSNPGTYTVTNTIAASGGCPATSAMAMVTIAQSVTVSAGPAQTVVTGTPVQLAGSITGGATTGNWSGGTGTFSPGKSSLNAIYTPGPGETAVYLTLTSDNPAAPCGPQSDVVLINFVAGPAAPTVQGITSICDGTSTTLTATAPGGKYEWFSTATGNNIVFTGASFTTVWLTQTTSYYVQTTINGLTSARTPVTITINTVPVAPKVIAPKTCAGSSAMLTATNSTGNYQWYDAAAGGNLLYTGATYVTPVLQVNTSYYVQAQQNNCTSPRTEVDIPVSTIPSITSGNSDMVCTGNALNYSITSDAPLPSYSWSRAAVAGISNGAVNNQNSTTITETLVNTTSNPIDVTYMITPFNGTCSGQQFNYVVTVNPLPTVTSTVSPPPVCNDGSDDYQITFSATVSKFTWSRAAVNGISNKAVSGQQAAIIEETLLNTTNAPIVVPYVINYQTATCTGIPFTFNETVNPTAVVTSDPTGTICSGTAQSYTITSSIPGSTYSWSRDAVDGISNGAVQNNTSSTITETLINTTTGTVNVNYTIVPAAYGCPGTPFIYTVTVNPLPGQANPKSNSHVCVGNTLNLFSDKVSNATYLWTAPDGTTYTTANVSIPNATMAMAGTYTLVVTNKYGCAGPSIPTVVYIDAPGIAIASTPLKNVCSTVPYIQLYGQIQDGPQTGFWSGGANPNGFSSPNSVSNTVYVPGPADIAAGSVTLTLTSTSVAGCNNSTSSVTVTFGPVPGVDAGPYQAVCSQTNAVQLAGQMLLPVNINWTSPTGGKFLPSSDITTPMYVPTAADIKNGSVILTLNVVNGGACIIASDTMSIKFIGPPVITPGGVINIFKGGKITLNPVINEDNLTYLWAPDIDINSVNIKNPVITGDIDRFYTLTVTDSKGCQSTDTTYVKVTPNIMIPNTFSPNGDGINDTWDIQALNSYPMSETSIFNRYGALLFTSTGYEKPWDGNYHGKPVPSGTYYYIIDLKNGKRYKGFVEVIR